MPASGVVYESSVLDLGEPRVDGLRMWTMLTGDRAAIVVHVPRAIRSAHGFEGGPWCVFYERGHNETRRTREQMAFAAECAESVMWTYLETHAPQTFAECTRLGWVTVQR